MELSRPFAENGDRIDFPENAQGDGDLSLEQGFGPRFALPPEESGLFIDRQKYNQLMYLITKGVIDAKEAVKLMQQGMTEGLAKLTEFETKLSGFTSRLDSLENEVANIDESLIGGKVVTLVDKDVFITVGNPGSGAQFERLEDALYEGMKYKPINNHYVFVVLKTNLTLDYSLFFFGVDMSHIIVTGWFDGTQGQVKPPIHQCKHIYFDIMGALRRQQEAGEFLYHGDGMTPLFYLKNSSSWTYNGVVFSHKEQLPSIQEIKQQYPLFVGFGYGSCPFYHCQSSLVYSSMEDLSFYLYLKKTYNVNYDIINKDIINNHKSIHSLNVFRSIGVRTVVFHSYESYLHAYFLYIENGTMSGSAISLIENSNCIHNQTTNKGLTFLLDSGRSFHDYRYMTFIFRTGSKLTNLFLLSDCNMWFRPIYKCMGDMSTLTNICNVASNVITSQGIFFEVENATNWRNNPAPYPTILDTYFPLHQSGWTEADHNPNVNLPLQSEVLKK